MKKHYHHKCAYISIIISLFLATLIIGISMVLTGQLTIPNLTQIATINIVDKGERDSITTKSTKTPTVIKPTTTTKTTTRTERDEDIDGKGMNTKITTTVNTTTDTEGNKTTSTAIVSTSVNNKGLPTSPVDTKTTIIKQEPADGSTPKIIAVTETVTKEKTDEGFITHTKTTTTDVPTQESTTQYATSENFSTKEKTDEGFITNNTTITRDDITGDIVADKTNTTSTIANTNSSVEKTDDGFIRTNTTITRDANTGNIVDAYSVTSTPTPPPTSTPKPSKEPESFWETVADTLNNSDDSLPGLGTNGLGGGNAPVVTPPMSIITSDNPQDLTDFYKGVAYSMGAGAMTAGTVLVGGAIIPQIVSLAGATGSVTATSLAQATAAYGAATLVTLPAAAQATLAYGGSALILGGTAYATNECIESNDPGSPACVGLVTGYQTDPIGFNQALDESLNTLLVNPIKYFSRTPTTTNITPDFNLSVSQTNLTKDVNSVPEITQVSSRKVTIKTEGQFISIDLDDSSLNTIISNGVDELKGLSGDAYWDKLYEIKARYGTDQFTTPESISRYDLEQTLAVANNDPIPLSKILSEKQGVCLELSCLIQLINNSADNAPKKLIMDIYVPANGYDIGHATNASELIDPLTRLSDFGSTFSPDNIGAIQRVDFWK